MDWAENLLDRLVPHPIRPRLQRARRIVENVRREVAFFGVAIDEQGGLALKTSVGEVRWHKPVVYQEIDGVRRTVEGRYIQNRKTEVGFEIGTYDPSATLVIDPVLT